MWLVHLFKTLQGNRLDSARLQCAGTIVPFRSRWVTEFSYPGPFVGQKGGTLSPRSVTSKQNLQKGLCKPGHNVQ